MNKKGQALVEFIMVFPILLILIISLVDVGNIYIKKYELNKDLEIVSEYYEIGKNQELLAYVSSGDIEFFEEKNGDLTILSLKKKVNVNAPILSNIIGKKYTIEVKKPILEDSNG